jgi:hypothetical protein
MTPLQEFIGSIRNCTSFIDQKELLLKPYPTVGYSHAPNLLLRM